MIMLKGEKSKEKVYLLFLLDGKKNGAMRVDKDSNKTVSKVYILNTSSVMKRKREMKRNKKPEKP